MNNSPEIENIIEQSIEIAKGHNHQYVTVEHLLLALIKFIPFKKCLTQYGVEIDLMINEIEAYISGLHAIESKEPHTIPKKTNALERVMNRSVTQVLFTGRRQVTTIDLYLSIAAESSTHAHYFLLKYGIRKTEFIEFYQKNHQPETNKMNAQQATDILEEHCTNISAMAAKNQLEPLIGRGAELEDMITVLARRFKANV
ncbi:MAG: Clp protease N-terminal domain-containing protein, partial [bacterium]